MNIPRGFIKDSDGNYRRGSYLFINGEIVKESTLLPNEKTVNDLTQTEFDSLDSCINAVLAYSSDIGEIPRTKDVYISKKNDKFNITEDKDDSVVAIITPQNNVYNLRMTEIVDQDDTSKLKSEDKDNAKAPDEVKDLNTKPVELKESTELQYTKEVRTKDGKESIMFTDDVSDYSAIKQFVKDYVTGYTEDDVEVIHFDKPVVTSTEIKKEADEETEDEKSEESEPKKDELKPLSSTYFIRRPNNIDELRDKISKRLVTPATYSIVDEVELSQDEFDKYANNLRQDKDFLKSFRPTPTDADFTCIAVKAPDRPTLLIDNSGYDSAQYVGVLQ